MDEKEEAFLRELRATFNAEAAEHLKAMTEGLLDLEPAPGPDRAAAIVEAVFREAHSLKGAARAVQMADIEAICRSLESAFGALKRGDLSPSPELFDTLYRAIDRVHALLGATGAERPGIGELLGELARLDLGGREGPAPGPSGAARQPVEESPRQAPEHGVPAGQPKAAAVGPLLTPSEAGPTGHPGPQPSPDKVALPETVRIATAKLDAVLLQAEEMVALRLAASQRAADLREVRAALDHWQKEWARVQPALRARQRAMEDTENGAVEREVGADTTTLLEFLDWSQPHLALLENRLAASVKDAERDAMAVGGMVGRLIEDVKQILMLPCSSLLDLCPRVVRDLARDQGKEVELALSGAEVEIDRRILEQLRDPLIHLLRNAIDHGIETPELRQAHGKRRHGKVTVAVSQVDATKVEFLISDDGAGIDPAQVRTAAVRRGVISPEEATTVGDPETLGLIFRSGVSTSPIITDISGRGLGLPIVREKVDKLGGVITMQTTPGAGSSFRILLPITLATFRGVLVEAAGQRFVLPIDRVERVLGVRRDEIRTLENRATIDLAGRTTSFVWLHDVLGLKRRSETAPGEDFALAAVLRGAEQSIAFGVDAVLGEQEVLVKSLGRQLSRVRNVAGATVLGSGKVVPILNVPDLLKSALKVAAAPAQVAVAAPAVVAKRRSILVVEDSITARMFLKNILESAGYQVATAVDGADGFATLKTKEFDLVVSDVDMPRLNGFDLTARIRADQRLGELPVVLVTALESRTDRERGVDVGASAYIVKSSFVQSNLLDVVQRLLRK